MPSITNTDLGLYWVQNATGLTHAPMRLSFRGAKRKSGLFRFNLGVLGVSYLFAVFPIADLLQSADILYVLLPVDITMLGRILEQNSVSWQNQHFFCARVAELGRGGVCNPHACHTSWPGRAARN